MVESLLCELEARPFHQQALAQHHRACVGTIAHPIQLRVPRQSCSNHKTKPRAKKVRLPSSPGLPVVLGKKPPEYWRKNNQPWYLRSETSKKVKKLQKTSELKPQRYGHCFSARSFQSMFNQRTQFPVFSRFRTTRFADRQRRPCVPSCQDGRRI